MSHLEADTDADELVQAAPSLSEKAKNFIGSAAVFVADGGKLVSPAERQGRLAVCKGCEFLIRAKKPECEVCGCKVLVKSKGRAFSCILGRWPGDPPVAPEIIQAKIDELHRRRREKQRAQTRKPSVAAPPVVQDQRPTDRSNGTQVPLNSGMMTGPVSPRKDPGGRPSVSSILSAMFPDESY